jgi:hypothetical protein
VTQILNHRAQPMTRMSEPSHAMPAAAGGNPLQSWTRSRLARAVHAALQIVGTPFAMPGLSSLLPLAALAAPGCVIPPSLSVDKQDAGINSPPAILSVTSDGQVLSEPGPLVFDMGATAGDLSLQLLDTDTQDSLFVRIFVDYNLPDRLDARARCQAGPSPNTIRNVTCKLNSLCVTADLGVQRNMTIVVFDRDTLAPGMGDPPFQAMPEGGRKASQFYFLKCQPPQT